MPLEYRPSAELPDTQYPLILTTERSLYHYHTGTMTRRVSGLNILKSQELVEINPGTLRQAVFLMAIWSKSARAGER